MPRRPSRRPLVVPPPDRKPDPDPSPAKPEPEEPLRPIVIPLPTDPNRRELQPAALI